MAKKKRKRAVPSGRSGGMGTTTKVPGGNEGAAVRPAPASPGGPNRLERKEAARRARERLALDEHFAGESASGCRGLDGLAI